jgi:hypothetical protein
MDKKAESAGDPSADARYPSAPISRANLPLKIPYDPPAFVFALNLAVGVGLVFIGSSLNGRILHGFLLWFGSFVILSAPLGAVRRFVFRRWLVPCCDALHLPTGFGRARMVRIPYGSIRRAWRPSFTAVAVVYVATVERKFEVIPMMFPDAYAFAAVADFLHEQAEQNRRSK